MSLAKAWAQRITAEGLGPGRDLTEVCDLAVECSKVFAVPFSFEGFEKATNDDYKHTFGKSYWLGAAMFIASLVQQKMQK